MLNDEIKKKKNQLGKEKKNRVNWVNLLNSRFKTWLWVNLIKDKLKTIMNLNPQ